ncbi:MAG: hypothetical protein Q4D22_03660, partial [Candidatus Saccharibacteria bacterium]|nr:hypothetical protein [Candidatus Saccharibacteria bacterium]
MAGENPPKNTSEENPNMNGWENMDSPEETPMTEAEYYRKHPEDIHRLAGDLIELRGADSVKEGTWDKDLRAHVGEDGIPREWAQMTGYLKKHPEAIDAVLEERDRLRAEAEGESDKKAPAKEGNRFAYYPRGRIDENGKLGVRMDDPEHGRSSVPEGRGETNEEYSLRNKWMTEMTRLAEENPLQDGEKTADWQKRVGALGFEEWKAARVAGEGAGAEDDTADDDEELDMAAAGGGEGAEDGGEDAEDTGEDAEDGAEDGEDAEHERLIHGIFSHYTKGIFAAADELGIPLDNVFDLRKMSNEELQPLFDKLNEAPADGAGAGAAETDSSDSGEDGGSAEGDDDSADAGETDDAPAEGEGEGGSEGDGESEPRVIIDTVVHPDGTEEPADGGETTDHEGGTPEESAPADGETEEAEERKVGFFRKIGRRIGEFVKKYGRRIGIGAAALLLLFGAGSRINKNIQNVPTSTGDEQRETFDGDLDQRYQEALENMESHGILDGYGEKGMWLSETKTGPYNFADAEAVAEAVETDDAREMVKYTAFHQSESFADYMVGMPDEARPEQLRGITDIREMEAAIEGLSNDDHKAVFEAFSDTLDGATVEDVVLEGRYDNAYMRLQDREGDVVHQNMELVRCTTTEHGTHAKRIIIHDKEGNEIGSFIVKANADTSVGKKGCMQVVRPVGAPELETLPEVPENPEEPGEPEP